MHEQIDKLSIDDMVLVRRAQHGDTEAVSRLILKYQDRVYNTIMKILMELMVWNILLGQLWNLNKTTI